MYKVIFEHSSHEKSEEVVAEFATVEEAKNFVEEFCTDDPDEVDRLVFPEGVNVYVEGDDGSCLMWTNEWEDMAKFTAVIDFMEEGL